MQKKTIQRIVKSKINDWLSTINDESLRKSLEDNIIVSGGCIASLFLGEDVNDYDVYIQDMDVLHKLTEYYANPYSALQVLDGRKKDSYLNDEDEFGQYANSVNNLKEDQIKIFVNGDSGGYKVTGIKKDAKPYHPVFFSPNAISLSDDLQIVVRFCGDHTEIHKNFDFIHATNYFTLTEGLVTNLRAMESLITKQLVYQGSLYPLTSIIRVRKFIKRKWNIGAGELLKIMFHISELDLKDVQVLEEQLIGVDVAYFEQLIKAIHEAKTKNKEFKIDRTFIGKLIDKIFGGE